MQKSIRTPEQQYLQELLRKVRTEAGLSQVDVAERLGKPQSFISKYESGERRLDLPELQDVCRAIGVSLEKLVKRFVNGIGERK